MNMTISAFVYMKTPQGTFRFHSTSKGKDNLLLCAETCNKDTFYVLTKLLQKQWNIVHGAL